jgi:flagella basal body P-ring formation protein FlgA
MMKRLIAIALFVGLGAPAVAQDTGDVPLAPVLKAHVVVSGDIVRIGDLVEHAGAAAKIPVFRAPDLGETGTVAAMRVVEDVRAHNVVALDTRDLTEISVTRASRVIASKDIESALAAALSARHGFRPTDLAFAFDREIRPLHVEPDASASPRLVQLAFDQRSGRFDATMEIAATADGRRRTLRLTGVATETFKSVVLTRPVARGEVLKAADLIIERRHKSDRAPDSVIDMADAVGQAARSTLRAGQPLRQGDLMRPEFVQRNESVIVIYAVPGITLTARGKALESGAEGDTITVLNVQSKRNMHGVVTGPGRVTVSALAPRATTDLADSNASPKKVQ